MSFEILEWVLGEQYLRMSLRVILGFCVMLREDVY